MARKLRLVFEGAIYHVTFRGVRRESIFRDDADRLRFLESLADRVESFQVRLYLYCLMSNHVHLVVETPAANLPAFMGSLLTSYSTYFNRRHRRHGHLTQGRYNSPLVEGDQYLLRLTRYVHLNPVEIKALRNAPVPERRKALRGYRWSSYRAYAGLAMPETFVEYQPMWNLARPYREGKLQVRYRRFVEEGLLERDEEMEELIQAGGLGIGSEAFVEDLQRQYEERLTETVPEDALLRHVASRANPEHILEEVCAYYGLEEADVKRHRKGDDVKPVVAWLLTVAGGLSQREAAPWIGVGTGAAVSVHLQRLRASKSKGQEEALAHFCAIFDI